MLALLVTAVHLTLPKEGTDLFPDLRAAAGKLIPEPVRGAALASIDGLEQAASAGGVAGLDMAVPPATPEQGHRQRELRVKFAAVLDAFKATPLEERVMKLAVAIGAFRALYQYPPCFNARVRSTSPVFREDDHPSLARAVRALEAASGAIAAEYAAFPPAMHVTNVEDLVDTKGAADSNGGAGGGSGGYGGWTAVQVYVAGTCLREHAFPSTCAVLRAIARGLGGGAKARRLLPRLMAARFNRMGARVRVVPHLSLSNQRLKLHLGVRVPPGIELRIANRTARWAEGKVLILDDSFRHSIRGDNDSPRVVLEVEIRHPDLIDGRAPFLGPVGGGCFVQLHANGTVPARVAQGAPAAVDESAGAFRTCHAELEARCRGHVQTSPSAKACRECALLHMEALATAGCVVDSAVVACDQLLHEVEAERSDERDSDEEEEEL